MTILVSGGCKNGKSSLAQDFACEAAKKCGSRPIYFATMIPHDSEDHERIEKHRADRKNLGFETIECGKNLSETIEKMEAGRVVLFDSLTALVANELFSEDVISHSDENAARITQKIRADLTALIKKSESVIFVSDAIFSDGKIYDETTELYRKILAETENFIAKKSDKVVEMSAGVRNEELGMRNENKLLFRMHGANREIYKTPHSSLLTSHLIIGGAYQGKTSWAKEQFSFSDDDIYVCDSDSLPDFSKRCISHYENYVAYCLKHNLAPKTDFSDCANEEAGEGKDAKIIICDDIFCGVVPIDSFQRKWREETGLALQKIAKQAEVTRIFCGIPFPNSKADRNPQTLMENSSRFFKNTACSYFPCHKGLDSSEFNCLFCYCPLYPREVCPGNPTFITKDDGTKIKRCTDCTFPHKPENYERIMNLLRVTKNEIDTAEYHHGDEVCSARMRSKSKARKFCLPLGEQNFLAGKEITGCNFFSVNINPLGLPEGVKSAIQNAIPDLERYPDQNCTRLREKLAGTHSLSPEHIFCGNGASELISLVTNAISPKNALVLAPTFSGYEKALKAARAKVHYHFLKSESDFTLDESVFDSIQKTAPDMIFLCSPNNPTGRVIEKKLLEKMSVHCDESGIFLVVDECFLDFTERADETMLRFVEKNPHLIVLNAFTKIYAMAGIRLGYLATSNPALLHKINSLRPEWNVSTLAQIAGEAALAERDYINETRALIKQERDYLSKELKALGFRVFPSDANFILFEVNFQQFEENFQTDGGKTGSKSDNKVQKNLNMSEKIDEFLLKNGISLRNCGNFAGLSEKFYRTAVRTHGENVRLLEVLQKLRKSLV